MPKLILGDCLEKLKELEDNSVDSIVTDPPYGISFMGKKWDYDVPQVEVWQECLRVLKPGGHALVACGTRTQHRMAVNLEDGGFEIRDIVAWIYGSGFPKSLNIGKAIDKGLGRRTVSAEKLKIRLNQLRENKGYTKTAMNKVCGFEASNFFRTDNHLIDIFPKGDKWTKIKEVLGESKEIEDEIQGLYEEAEREVIGKRTTNLTVMQNIGGDNTSGEIEITKGNSKYEGWGTALKPAMELWTLCRKPLEEKTIASNVLKWGTGGINIEKSRVPTQDDEARKQKILSGEVVCNAFCDKHKSYPSSLFDILSFSRLQLYDFYQHIFSELGSYNNSYTNLLHNLEELDYKNYKQLLGVPYDCGLLAGRANEYVHAYQEVLNSQDDCPTLSRLYDVFVRCQKVSDQDVFPLSNDVQVDILHFLSSKENNQLNDNNPLLVFVLALVAYSLLVNNNLHNHYTTCKNKSKGRFPANIILDGSDEVVEGFPASKSTQARGVTRQPRTTGVWDGENNGLQNGSTEIEGYNDSGSASRFFYCAKSSKAERNKGLEGFDEIKVSDGRDKEADNAFQRGKTMRVNSHPTVKPVRLMQYLCRLITTKGGTILDPYMGSGSTGIGAKLENFKFIGIEMEEDYVKIAEARITNTPTKLI